MMKLTLDDLFETCPRCSGTGKASVEVEENDEGRAREGLGLGSGDCEACGGYGRGELTETGRALLDFIRIVERRDLI
jgi:hypothetical protein